MGINELAILAVSVATAGSLISALLVTRGRTRSCPTEESAGGAMIHEHLFESS